MNEFSIKPKFYFGHGSVESLLNIPIERAYIVCDPFMEKSGMTEKVTKLLEQKNAQYQVFSKVIPDPTIGVITESFPEITQFQPDTVIALGGGSAMDSAKVIRKVYSDATRVAQPVLIAIPTTSGSGSEMTSFAVISDPKNNQKIPLVDDSLLPEIAILDSAFTLSVPPTVTADAGMDVLTHCLEAYVSTGANDFTDACAEKSMKMVWENLITTYKEGDNVHARDKMHTASSLAGIAFNGAGLGLCHGMAHPFGAFFHLAHGRINAMLLPHIISYNAKLDSGEENEALKRYAQAAEVLGLKGQSPREKVLALIKGIEDMRAEMNMPSCLSETNVSKEDVIAKVSELVERALVDGCTSTNPRVAISEEIKEIYTRL